MAETNNIPKGFDIGKQYTPIATEQQKIENRKRNKERWAEYDEEYRKAWSETSTRTMKEYWEGLTPEQHAEETYNRARHWESKDEAYRKEHGTRSQIWRQDADKILAQRKKMIASGKWRDPELYREIYEKTLTFERYNYSGLYKKLSEEYNIPKSVIQHIAINISNYDIVSDKQHLKNMQKIRKEWDRVKAVREEELIEQRKNGKFWFDWEFISPGKGAEELYDYYNSKRTSNQRMPVKPSLVYYFREQGMKASEIREYCKKNKIYVNTDQSYWYKLAKHKYPWYSTDESVVTRFEKTSDAKEFAKKIFSSSIDFSKKKGLSKFGASAGWIIRQVKKRKNSRVR
tara:strand:+ start:1071 stop:2102 length:1032 start_codon:yes stop_codon:yes gene_type:complete